MAGSHRTDRFGRDSGGARAGLRRAGTVCLLGAAMVLPGLTGVAPASAAPVRQPAAGATITPWRVQPTPNQDRSGTGINLFSAVSCTSGRACTAVGSHATSLSSPSFGLAARWNGARWRIQRTILPRGASGSELRGVSCTSSTSCTAVGYAFQNAAHRSVGLAEAWNGTGWRVQVVPNPKGAADTTLLAVSCSSSKACTAVGFYANAAGQFALAERWNGRGWRIQALPKPAATEVYGVSCPAARTCVAVGHAANGPLAERWNGATWHVQAVPLPHGSSGGILAAVSCSSPRACTATGGSFGTPHPALAERWNGKRWAVQPAPNPADISTTHQEPELNAVSCRSDAACTATGAYAPGGHSAYWLESWNGHGWRLVSAPHPTGFGSGALNGVSCVLARCTAVGAWSGGPISIATLAMAN